MSKTAWGIWIVVIGLVVGAVVYFYPKPVDIVSEGYKYRLGETESKDERLIQVEVKGAIYRDWRGNRTFRGTIDLEGENLPEPEIKRDVELKLSKERYGIFVVYVYPSSHIVGTTYFNENFNGMAIALMETKDDENQSSGWSAGDGLMIAAPASNREDALALSGEVMEFYLDGYELK